MIKYLLLLLLCLNADAAYIANPITTDGVKFRVESARISGVCGILSQSGGAWISSVSGTGSSTVCTINVAASKFSSAPVCVLTSEFASTVAVCRLNAAPTTSAIAVACFLSTTGAGSDSAFHVMCMGPR